MKIIHNKDYWDVESLEIIDLNACPILSLPDSSFYRENRLLVVHGLIDENVHFHHTSLLIDELVKHCKPYSLQVRITEHHSYAMVTSPHKAIS